jgi:hypothetical protein
MSPASARHHRLFRRSPRLADGGGTRRGYLNLPRPARWHPLGSGAAG